MVELLDVISLRRWILAGVAVAVGLAGAVVAAFLPEVLPPRPLAGAAVGLAGYLLGLATAIAVDAADPIIRGRRHVEATGAVIAATITGYMPDVELVAWVERLIREGKGLRIAVTATGSDAPGSGQVADELGVALARRGWHVLVTNLEKTNEEWPGASEVCGGEVKLSDVVEFHPSLHLARLGPGQDRARALSEFTMLSSSLPADVDVLVVALPGLGSLGTLPALAAVDRALLLAATEVTSRVELLAALESVDEIRMPSDVVLVSGLAAVEPGLSTADPIDLWSQAMTTVADPGDAWRGEMVTIVAPPSKQGAGTPQPFAAPARPAPEDVGHAGAGPEAADRMRYSETQPATSGVDSTGRLGDLLAPWEVPTSPQGTVRRARGGGTRPVPPPPSGDPSLGGGVWPHPGTPRQTAAGHPIHEEYGDERRETASGPAPAETGLDDPETELRLAAWLNALEEDESPEEADGGGAEGMAREGR
ncbi:MAG: hypothetical protein M3O70_13875 [Actinomycetota bacterium]|nr:hypothetical protein [Actinomycetota bacterium]